MRHRRAFSGLAWAVLAAAGVAGGADFPRASGAWARATPPGATVGAVYLRIDGGVTPDRLLGASTPRALRVEFHRVETTAGMVRMRQADAIDVPAGSRVEFAPQGLHLMLMGLASPLRVGEVLPLTLRFESAGVLALEAQVRD